MDELLQILKHRHPDIDFETEDGRIEKKILDSFDLFTIIAEISRVMKVKIPPKAISPANFHSAQAMWELIEKCKNEGKR